MLQMVGLRYTIALIHSTLEGHLFRASQRVGANNAEQLISMLRG